MGWDEAGWTCTGWYRDPVAPGSDLEGWGWTTWTRRPARRFPPPMHPVDHDTRCEQGWRNSSGRNQQRSNGAEEVGQKRRWQTDT